MRQSLKLAIMAPPSPKPKIQLTSGEAEGGLKRISGEYPVERIIRIARNNGIDKIICLLNSGQTELRDFLTSRDFGVSVKFLVQNSINSLHSFLTLTPFLKDSHFCLTTTDSVFREDDFSEFLNYSLISEDLDGTIAIRARTEKDENLLSVAMDQDNKIIKFSDLKEGYNWVSAEISFFTHGILGDLGLLQGAEAGGFRNFLRMMLKKGYVLKGFSVSDISESVLN